jgi:hypothetical protein
MATIIPDFPANLPENEEYFSPKPAKLSVMISIFNDIAKGEGNYLNCDFLDFADYLEKRIITVIKIIRRISLPRRI